MVNLCVSCRRQEGRLGEPSPSEIKLEEVLDRFSVAVTAPSMGTPLREQRAAQADTCHEQTAGPTDGTGVK